MAARRPRYTDFSPPQPTRIHTVSTREARDEQARFPGTGRARPAPINLAPGEPSPLLNGSPSPDCSDICDSPAGPDIVDVAAPNTWPRRGLPKQRSLGTRIASPHLSLQPPSARQSEISFGILDYYMRAPSPLPVSNYPPTPRIETPVLGPAMDKFDFGLPSSPNLSNPQVRQSPPNATTGVSKCTCPDKSVKLPPRSSPPDATAGALRCACPDKGISAQPRPSIQLDSRPTYRLFPSVKEDGTTAGSIISTQRTPPSSIITAVPSHPQPSAPSDLMGPQTPPGPSVTSTIAFVPSHPQPDPSYRPRKESMTGSARSRKDSFTSFSGTRRFPMRILSSSTTTTTSKTVSSLDSPPDASSSTCHSRWSDETITSPLVATTPAPRVSFGVLLEGDRRDYPACFFEDDDEDATAPLRKKLRWKRPASSGDEHQRRKGKVGRFDERGSGWRVRRWVLCGCGG